MNMSGHGIPQNYTEAARQLRKAADQGHAGAQYILGKLFLNGYGVSQSNEKAAEWMKKAADQGHKEAIQAFQKIASE